MVSSTHPLATESGLNVLKNGGKAIVTPLVESAALNNMKSTAEFGMFAVPPSIGIRLTQSFRLKAELPTTDRLAGAILA